MRAGIVLIVADSALFMINIGNTWSTSVLSEIKDIFKTLNISCLQRPPGSDGPADERHRSEQSWLCKEQLCWLSFYLELAANRGKIYP